MLSPARGAIVGGTDRVKIQVYEPSLAVSDPVRWSVDSEDPLDLTATGVTENTNYDCGLDCRVFEFDLDRTQHRDILRRYREMLRPGIPIRVLVKEGQHEKYADLLEGAEVWTHNPTVGDLDAFSSRVEAFERTEET